MSQLTAIALQHFRAKREKHHSNKSFKTIYRSQDQELLNRNDAVRQEKLTASILVQKHLSCFAVSEIIGRIWELIANALRVSA